MFYAHNTLVKYKTTYNQNIRAMGNFTPDTNVAGTRSRAEFHLSYQLPNNIPLSHNKKI